MPALRLRLSSSGSPEGSPPLYPRHIPTSGLQKLLLAAGSAVAALSDPYRADMVAVNGEVTGGAALRYMHDTMLGSAEGRAVLAARPRIHSGQLPALARLPPASLGHSYQAFLARYNITPDSRAQVQFVDCPDLAYVMTRYRETHDLTHLVLDMPTNMVGEVAVKWVEALQLGLPMAVGGAILGPLRYSAKQRRQHRLLLPWAVATGRSMAPLLPVYWEERWHQDIGDFRREFGIRPAPAL